MMNINGIQNKLRHLEMERNQICRSMVCVENMLVNAIDKTESQELLELVVGISNEIIQGFRGYEPRVAQGFIRVRELAEQKRKNVSK